LEAKVAEGIDMGRLAARFWPKVNKDGPIIRPELGACWVWIAAKKKDPKRGEYGRIGVGGKAQAAHRVSFLLAHGRWPEPAALHRCDNPPCVNPSHLYEGDVRQNSLDMKARGRHRPVKLLGEANPSARLTTEIVVEIRRRHALGPVSPSQLGREFGLNPSHVRDVIDRRTWADVSPDSDAAAPPARAIPAARKLSTARHRFTLHGETLTAVEWAERLGVESYLLLQRRSYGWSDERALTQPVRRRRLTSRIKRGR
jgi:hypothetical protein